MTPPEIALDLLQGFAVIIVMGILAAKLARQLHIPDIILLLLAGMLVGPACLQLVKAPSNTVMSQLIFTAGVAFILFEGGMGLTFKTLRPTLITILLLSTVGVVVSAAVTGLAAGFIWGLPPLVAFLLGAIIAPTDPTSLIPLFNQVKVRVKCRRTLIAESALNDATGAILVLALAGALAHGAAVPAPGTMLLDMLCEAGIGLLVGLLIGYVLVVMVVEDAYRLNLSGSWIHLSPQLMLLGAISAYTIATRFHGSGFMAAFVAGLVLEDVEHDPTLHFVEHLSSLFRTLIFISLGSNIDVRAIWANLGWSCLVVLVFVGVARPLIVWGCALWDRQAQWTTRELLLLTWARPTGVMPAALLGLLASRNLPHFDKIYSVALLAVLFTIVVQASTTQWWARRLGLVVDEVSIPSER